MDASSGSELHIGKRATAPKHGKKPENRLWSRWRRGNGVKESGGGGTINPDATIRVAAVCGSEVRIYQKSKAGRGLIEVINFVNHGAALDFAYEHDKAERRSHESSSAASGRVFAPFYLVKVAGRVIEHTNSRDFAHYVLRSGCATPKELWRINDSGVSELLERVAA